MNISQFLHTLVAITLDDLSIDDQCSSHSKDLVHCLQDISGLDQAAARQCITCPISNTRGSTATTCEQFEAEGFCDNVRECQHEYCPTACWKEFEDWLQCKMEGIGCPTICQEEFDFGGALIA
mmetsp:Transcript_18519/g.40090  ORF Transcript_18519/g.40090 Transcript_18519/m.40090 type:complete len:123 (+) Transcript_18519:117-485(+)